VDRKKKGEGEEIRKRNYGIGGGRKSQKEVMGKGGLPSK
jgi:hypothetical protein